MRPADPSGWGYPLTVERTVTNANGTVTTTLPGGRDRP